MIYEEVNVVKGIFNSDADFEGELGFGYGRVKVEEYLIL
jgi:hypothetical protein